MAAISSTLQLSEVNTNPSPSMRAPNRLHKKAAKEKKSPRLLGVKIKRISEFEPVSNCSRGTLGGFVPLCDVGSGNGDNTSLEKGKAAERECVLTHLTKKIGLGIYTRARGIRSESNEELADGHVEEDGAERETWYMFYPPPPSPSLALEPKEWNSISSSDIEHESQSQPASEIASGAESENGLYSHPSASSRESLYTSSPLGLTTEDPLSQRTDNQNIDIDALIASADHLAEQYRELLSSHDTRPSPIPGYKTPHDRNLAVNFPVCFSDLDYTPKTIRKVKRQHSLRKLTDVRRSQLLSGPISSVPTLLTSHSSIPSPVTSPITPSGTSFVFPFSPPSIKSGAASSHSRLNQKKRSPEPPPRESSLGRIPKKLLGVEVEVLPSTLSKKQWKDAFWIVDGDEDTIGSEEGVKLQGGPKRGDQVASEWRRYGMVGVEDREGQWWV